MTVTRGLLEYCDPHAWSVHRFGLPPHRWNALAGQAIWVTGAGSGFGAAIATILAAAGGRPILSGRRREKLEDARMAMRDLGVDPEYASIIPCDVRDEVELARAAGEIAGRFGYLSGLVVCAALPQPRPTPWPFADLHRESWQSLFDTNLTAPWLTTRAALPLMLSAGRVRVLLLTSEAGWADTPGFGPYNVSKAALNSLGASLAAETAASHPAADIQINVLNPGEAKSEMNQGSTVSPYAAVAATLALLSHPSGGPNGRFFARDGRHLEFAYSKAWGKPLLP
jgi:NAD(P)-dependent dehydrogenase (short-subunit alcohol dehydrogenase family)